MGNWRTRTVFMLAFLGLLVVLTGSSESFQDCIQQRKNTKPYDALHEKNGLLIKIVRRTQLNIACTRVTAGENDGAIAALAAIILAFFNYALWQATDGLLRVTQKSIELTERSLILLESPILVVEEINVGEITKYRQVNFYVKNYGRTTARLIEYSADLIFADTIPSYPVYGDTIYRDRMVAIGQPGHGIVVKVPEAFEASTLEDFRDKKIKGFLIGFIRYDGLGGTIRKGFGAELTFNMNGVHSIAGGKAYNYTLKEV